MNLDLSSIYPTDTMLKNIEIFTMCDESKFLNLSYLDEISRIHLFIRFYHSKLTEFLSASHDVQTTLYQILQIARNRNLYSFFIQPFIRGEAIREQTLESIESDLITSYHNFNTINTLLTPLIQRSYKYFTNAYEICPSTRSTVLSLIQTIDQLLDEISIMFSSYERNRIIEVTDELSFAMNKNLNPRYSNTHEDSLTSYESLNDFNEIRNIDGYIRVKKVTNHTANIIGHIEKYYNSVFDFHLKCKNDILKAYYFTAELMGNSLITRELKNMLETIATMNINELDCQVFSDEIVTDLRDGFLICDKYLEKLGNQCKKLENDYPFLNNSQLKITRDYRLISDSIELMENKFYQYATKLALYEEDDFA
jgi:hypothetical protein